MKAINLLCSFILILSAGTAHAQALPVEWAKSAGGTGSTSARSVATDPSGNSFVTGTFTNSGLTIGATTLANAGYTNIFLAKYDGAGNALWAKSCQGNNIDYSYQVAADHSGNAIITGYYESNLFIIGTDTLSTTFSFGFQHNFVAKFDPSGNLLWADHAGQGNASGLTLAVDPSDNIFVAGLFNCPYIVFGSDTLKDTSNFIFGNIFLVKYNSSGNVLWAISSTGANPDAINSLATDPWGNLYVTGFVTSPVFTLGSYSLNNPGGQRRVLTAKISTNGNVIWAKLSSAAYNGSGNSVTTDLTGNPYITGVFQGDSIAFGTTTAYNYAYVDTFFNRAMFVVKYDTAGNALWAKEEGFSTAAYESVSGAGIVTDGGNNVYVTGNFQGNTVLNYGSDILYSDSANHNNLFVAAYDGSGNHIWARSPSGGGNYFGSSITINNSGALYICGGYQHAAINFGFTSLPVADSGNAFIAKLNPAITSVKNFSEGNDDIKVYPVPSDYLLHVSLPGNGYSALKIYDLSGREVLVQACNASGNNSEYVLDVSKLAPGTYLVQAIQNGFKINRKIVIVRNG